VPEYDDEALLCQDGHPVDTHPLGDLDLFVLTPIGYIYGNVEVYFAPNPKVYLEAVNQHDVYGVPVGVAYQRIWRRLGMEHEAWHERA